MTLEGGRRDLNKDTGVQDCWDGVGAKHVAQSSGLRVMLSLQEEKAGTGQPLTLA